MRPNLLLLSLLATACSSTDSAPAGGTGTPPPTTPPPGDTTTAPPAPPPPPVPGTLPPPATTPTFDACTVTDADAYFGLGGAGAGGGTLYVIGGTGYTRRYAASSSGACAITRDATFANGTPDSMNGQISTGDAIQADSSGALWQSYFGWYLERDYPAPPVKCSADPSLPDGSKDVNGMIGFFALDPAGTSGFAYYVNAKIWARVSATSTACSVAPLTVDQDFVLSGLSGGVVDSFGRLHVTGVLNGSLAAAIVGGDGHVTPYGAAAAKAVHADGGTSVRWARCGDFECVLDLGMQVVQILDANGVPRSTATITFDGSGDVAIAGDATGAVYVMTTAQATSGSLTVQRAIVKP
ncbi:MAG TPA: hypothetical protein VIF62_01180 [Labilithrix sp.]